MRIRRKTKRRAVMLLVGVGLLVTTAAAAYKLRTVQIERETMQWRQEGMAALEKQNYYDAMHAIGRYVNRHPRDAEALYAYARARQRVGEPYAAHLTQAMGVLQRVLSLEPGNIEARRDLLSLYDRLGFGHETLETADDLLKHVPDDAQGLRCRTVALVRLQRLGEAREAAEKFAKQYPMDVQGHLRLLAIMRKQGVPEDQVIAAAEKVHDSNPQEPRYKLLMALVYRGAGNRVEALKWAEQVTQDVPADAQFIEQLVRMLDQMEQFDLSNQVLEDVATRTDDPQIRRQLVRRSWESGQWGEVIQKLSALNHDSPDADAELLALKAMAMMKLNRAEEALPIAAALDAREGDTEAQAWASLLNVRFEQDATHSDVIDLCRQALARVPSHPYFQFMLGDAYAAAGELDLALDAWVRSAQDAPAWALPMIRAAEAYRQTGRPTEAFGAARTAVKRAPSNIDAAIALAQVWLANLPAGDTNSSRELAKLVDQIQGAMPGEPRTLPIRVALHMRHDGRGAAARELQAILSSLDSLTHQTLLRLAEVSDEHELGLREQVLDTYEQKFGVTPALAYARAVAIAKQEGLEQGLEHITRASREGKGDALTWKLMRARLLEHEGDPRAGEQWVQLVEQEPDNRQVLHMALESQFIWRNRDFLEKAIERLGEMSGQHSPTYAQAKARWLLHHDRTDRGAAEAATLLNRLVRMSPSLVEPRLMLALCLRRLGHDSAAMKHLAVAAEQRPQSLPIVIQFAELAQRRGEYDAAREALRRAAGDQASVSDRQRIAQLLARQGDLGEAITVLEEARRDDAAAPDLLLARLHRQRGDREKTLALCRELLTQPTLPHIAFAADTYASYDMNDEAQAALAKLGELELSEDKKHLVLAAFAERHGDDDAVRRELESAVDAAPQNAATWAAWVRYLLQRGDAEEANTAIARAHELLPENETFDFLADHAEVLKTAASLPAARVVAVSLMDGPAHRGTGVEALRIVRRAESAKELSDVSLLELRRLVGDNPRYMALSNLVVRLHLMTGRNDQAVAMATRAVNLSRHDVEPAWLAAEAAAAAGHWNQALFLAQEWRRRSRGQSIMADLAIAQAHVQLNDAEQALRQLDPYLESATAEPAATHPAVLDQTVRALIAAGRVEQAESRLSPLLPEDPRWRKLWIDLAVLAISDADLSAHWLMRVEQYIPPQAADEQLMLAQGWYYLARSADRAEYDAAARRLLTQITDGPDAPAEALVLLGVMHHAEGDVAAAEQLYRRAVASDDHMALAHNNLASLLNDQDKPQEALKAARAAAELNPDNPEYQQTLASVHAARGDHAAAAEALRQAVKVDPYEPRWQTALIEQLAAGGEHDEARHAINRFDTHFDSSKLPETMQKQLDTLRRTLGVASAAAGGSVGG